MTAKTKKHLLDATEEAAKARGWLKTMNLPAADGDYPIAHITAAIDAIAEALRTPREDDDA